jgi:hypothetical protein
MSGGGGGGKTMTQSTKVELPQWADANAQRGTQLGTQLAQQDYPQYQGMRIAPFSPEQEMGLQMTTNRALSGSPVTNNANTLAANTLGGQYLDPSTNPAWQSGSQALADAYRTGTAATRNAAFSKAGAFGSDNSAFNQFSGQQDKAFGDSLGNLWGNIYNQERGFQNQALGMSPQLAQADYGDAQKLVGVGDARRGYTQDLANQSMQDFYGAQNYGWDQLNKLAGLQSSFLGNSGSTTATGPNPYQASPLASALGTGMLGYAGGSALAGGALAGSAMAPYAPWLGAALGAFGGLAMN